MLADSFSSNSGKSLSWLWPQAEWNAGSASLLAVSILQGFLGFHRMDCYRSVVGMQTKRLLRRPMLQFVPCLVHGTLLLHRGMTVPLNND
jgi:hypothetical protein